MCRKAGAVHGPGAQEGRKQQKMETLENDFADGGAISSVL